MNGSHFAEANKEVKGEILLEIFILTWSLNVCSILNYNYWSKLLSDCIKKLQSFHKDHALIK